GEMIRPRQSEDLFDGSAQNCKHDHFTERRSLTECASFGSRMIGDPLGDLALCWIARPEHHLMTMLQKSFRESPPDHSRSQNAYLHFLPPYSHYLRHCGPDSS